MTLGAEEMPFLPEGLMPELAGAGIVSCHASCSGEGSEPWELVCWH